MASDPTTDELVDVDSAARRSDELPLTQESTGEPAGINGEEIGEDSVARSSQTPEPLGVPLMRAPPPPGRVSPEGDTTNTRTSAQQNSPDSTASSGGGGTSTDGSYVVIGESVENAAGAASRTQDEGQPQAGNAERVRGGSGRNSVAEDVPVPNSDPPSRNSSQQNGSERAKLWRI